MRFFLRILLVACLGAWARAEVVRAEATHAAEPVPGTSKQLDLGGVALELVYIPTAADNDPSA